MTCLNSYNYSICVPQVDTKHRTVQRYAWVTVLQSRLDQFMHVVAVILVISKNYVWLIGRSQWPRDLKA
jgi:hypothetical protein